MTRRESGFTLIEVMITLVVLFLVMEAVTTFFTGWLRQYKQQSKIAESGVETLIGLEMLRKDIEHAGYGLPWNNIPGYAEATSGLLNDSPSNAPRGIVSLDDNAALSLNGSDYLVIKSAVVGTSPVSKRWTTLMPGGITRNWSDNTENFAATDRVIVLEPGSTGTNWRSLVPGSFSTTFAGAAAFAAADATQPRVIYGIDGPGLGGALMMPFNRADYYVTSAGVPQLCAPGTGMLVKAVVSVDNGTLSAPISLLECVASMHVIFFLDTNGDGAIDPPPVNAIPGGYTAQDIRNQLKEVRVYILAQEGQRDRDYTYSPATIPVGDPDSGVGGSYTLDATETNTNQTHFRWKVHTLVVKPSNLRE
ncbi:MAG: prepilin-type N-terminal cleavage/methylation domain-containing protein [Deltaproteobacteria bacterium]|nr:prepilin-type N-terminal cleavage/methylation domain-containing protein [Deltaproteobacteria bacterium]